MTPYNLAFRGYRFKDSKYSDFMYFIDAVFIIDIFINFVSAYEDNSKIIIADFKEIARYYYKTWFIIDFVSVIPFDIIFIYAIPSLELSDSYNRILKSFKIFYILQLFNQLESYIIFILKEYYGRNKNQT